MTETPRPRRILQSIGAGVAGILTVIVLSIGTDLAMTALGVFPSPGQPMSDSLLLLATLYRTVYGVAGSYIVARLAPNRPMTHALVLGVIGLVVSILGVVAMWNEGSVVGHRWYPLALVALSIPQSWVGGKLRVMQLHARADG